MQAPDRSAGGGNRDRRTAGMPQQWRPDMAHRLEPRVVVRGDVPATWVDYAHDKLRLLAEQAPARVLAVELRMDHHDDPARPTPDYVEMTIDLDGTPVRAHRSAGTASEAVDGAIDRLRRRVEAYTARPQERQLRHRGDTGADRASWHHGDRRSDRRAFFPRPPGERALVRRKTFAVGPESIEEALFDLEVLDHDFFLFVHDDTGREAVAYRAGDGYGIAQREATPDAITAVEIPVETGPPPATLTVDDACALLDASDAPFTFFVDAATGRGQVVYRRYDGNYGLIVPG